MAIEEAYKEINDHIVNGSCPTQDLRIVKAYQTSLQVLPGYATLDRQQCYDIDKLQESIGNYARDMTRKRPFNIMMSAAPGSGKSHFVKCLAKGMKDVVHVTANMTSIRDIDDLLGPLDEVRNLKAEGKLPILFLDEFDSDVQHYPLLLPLLWDGELSVGGRTLKLGKVVVILAGSSDLIGAGLHPNFPPFISRDRGYFPPSIRVRINSGIWRLVLF